MVRGQWGNLARTPGVKPPLFLVTTESGPRFNVSSEGRCFLQYSVPVTILGR